MVNKPILINKFIFKQLEKLFAFNNKKYTYVVFLLHSFQTNRSSPIYKL